jgi:hypothetical protein
MRGRLTLEKVNAAVNDMATYAEANAHLITAPKKKVLILLFFFFFFLILRHMCLILICPNYGFLSS